MSSIFAAACCHQPFCGPHRHRIIDNTGITHDSTTSKDFMSSLFFYVLGTCNCKSTKVSFEVNDLFLPFLTSPEMYPTDICMHAIKALLRTCPSYQHPSSWAFVHHSLIQYSGLRKLWTSPPTDISKIFDANSNRSFWCCGIETNGTEELDTEKVILFTDQLNI